MRETEDSAEAANHNHDPLSCPLSLSLSLLAGGAGASSSADDSARSADGPEASPSSSSSRPPAASPAMKKTTGLWHAPAGGVKNATVRYDLPPPPVAVRNLVSSVCGRGLWGVGVGVGRGFFRCAPARLVPPSPRSLALRSLCLPLSLPTPSPLNTPATSTPHFPQVEQAQYAHLCTIMSGMHHRRAGYPFGTLVDFASDGGGYPLFCLSPLAIHTRNVLEDPRTSLVVEMPGWAGLANARVTIFGEVYALPPDLQPAARAIFEAKHNAAGAGGGAGGGHWGSGAATFFRMHRLSDIYFVGGFGTVSWVDPAEYAAAAPDEVAAHEPAATLRALNETHGSALRTLLARRRSGQQQGGGGGGGGLASPAYPPPPAAAADDAAFISVDRLGADVRVRFGPDYAVERLGFGVPVHNLEEALAATQALLDAALGGEGGGGGASSSLGAAPLGGGSVVDAAVHPPRSPPAGTSRKS